MKLNEGLTQGAEPTQRLQDHAAEMAFVKVADARPDGYDGTCLRPLGLCELGGCCDTCWYRPNHPRFNSDPE